MIAELQFILAPMLKLKKQSHELYEILRMNDLITAVESIGEMTSLSQQCRIAFCTNDKRAAALAMTHFPGNVNTADNNQTPLTLAVNKFSFHFSIFEV